MKHWTYLIKHLTLLTQFGLSLITPLLICLGICWLLQAKAAAGAWVYLPGFFFGLGGSGMTAWKLYVSVTQKEKKRQKKKGISFNTHE